MKVYVINGPNLNLLGTREPEIYGTANLDSISRNCQRIGVELGFDVEFYQSNHEGEIIEWIQSAIHDADAIIINAAAYTHTSIAIHDALKAYSGFKIELHISNPHLRESFRHVSHVSTAADAVVTGLGVAGYELVLRMLPEILSREERTKFR